MADLVAGNFRIRYNDGQTQFSADGGVTWAQLGSGAGGSCVGALEYWAQVGATRLGLTSAQVAVDSSEFTEKVANDTEFWNMSGTITNPASSKGGVVQANTAGTSNFYRSAVSNFARATNAWYFYVRFSCASNAGATAHIGHAGFRNGNAGALITIGNLGSLNTEAPDPTKYNVYTYDGVTEHTYNSTIAVDTAFHHFEIWTVDGVSFYFAVDGETPIQLTKGNLPGASVYFQPFFEGSGAHGYQWDRFVALSSIA